MSDAVIRTRRPEDLPVASQPYAYPTQLTQRPTPMLNPAGLLQAWTGSWPVTWRRLGRLDHPDGRPVNLRHYVAARGQDAGRRKPA
jgi:hypothetical protein